MCGRPHTYGSGKHVTPLVDPRVPHYLSSQDLPCRHLEYDLHRHFPASGIVAGMRVMVGKHLVVPEALPFGLPLAEACEGHSHVEYLQYPRSLYPSVAALYSSNVVGRDPPLLVGRSSKGYGSGLSRDEVPYLSDVAHRINIVVRGPHIFIGLYKTSLVESEPGIFRKLALGPRPNGH